MMLARNSGVQSMELKGDINLQIADAARGRIGILLAPPFKQHPKIAKFGEG